jgi:hypothetical protein
METNLYFLSYLAQFFLEWEMFQTKFEEKITTHILCSIPVFFFENRVIYEIMWKNVVVPDRPWMKIWRIRIASWIPRRIQRLQCIWCSVPIRISRSLDWRLVTDVSEQPVGFIFKGQTVR